MRRVDLAPLLLLLPLSIALLPEGLPNTADMAVHFIRSAEMVHAWQDGVLLPRWSANLGFGYGIPLFNYAPPLPYLLAAFLYATGIPLEVALKGTLVVALLVAAWGSYTLLRSSFGTLASAVGAVAFLYAPYRLRELFIQGNVGQFLAWSFIPVALWGVARLWATGLTRFGIVVALSVAGALLSHNVVALMLGAILTAQTLALFLGSMIARRWGEQVPEPQELSKNNRPRHRESLRRLAQVAVAGFGGIALAAWFSIPALLEGQFVRLDNIVASDYRERFVPLRELIAFSPPLDRAAVNPYLPLTLGAVPVGLALLGVLALLLAGWRLSRSAYRALGWAYVLLALSGALMAHRISLPVWERLPFVELFEFPARWHGFTALGIAGGAGAGVALIRARNARVGRWVGATAIALLLLSSLVNLYPQRLPPGTLKAAPVDVVRFEEATGAVGTTSLAEFNPVWRTLPLTVSPLIEDYDADRAPERVERTSLPPGAGVETLKSGTESHRLRVTLREPATITLNLFYFPGWTAVANGIPLPLLPAENSGLATLALPAGVNEVALRFEDTPVRQWSEWLSLAAWAVLVLFLIRGIIRHRQQRTPYSRWALTVANGRALTLALLPALMAYIAFPAYLAPTSPPGAALPAQTPQRVDWGQELRLLGVDMPPDVLRGGQQVPFTAYVGALHPLHQNYAVYLHLDDSTGHTVATSDQRHPAEIPTSNLPAGTYVRVPFEIVIPAGLPPMKYTWRLGWYDPESGSPLLTKTGERDAEVGAAWLESTDRPRPSGPTATYGDSVHLRGAVLDRSGGMLTLHWEASAPVEGDFTVFVHLLGDGGSLVTQADGDPFDNRYPLTDWRAGQTFTETRPLPDAAYESVAIGIYHRGDGTRLPAFQAQQRLPDDALRLR